MADDGSLKYLDQKVGRVKDPHRLGQVEIIVEGVANLDDAREKVVAAATAFDPAWGERLHFVAQWS
jgi:hypothetical protein